MKIGETIYITERIKWRKWFTKNFQEKSEIWLIQPHINTGKPVLLYNNAVEEALCFGWIDSIKKKLDDDHAVQRYSPRNPKSSYSQANIERLRWLDKHKLLHPKISASVQDVITKEFVFPKDILGAIRENPAAWENFQKFSPAYKRIRIAYIDHSRANMEYFQKRLDYFIKKTAQNKQFGYGGIEKYF